MLLSVDPGIRHCGCAVFGDDGKLAIAALVCNPIKRGHHVAEALSMAQAVAEWHACFVTLRRGALALSFEWPIIYPVAKQVKGGNWTDPNDLLGLPAVATGIAALFLGADREGLRECTTYLPREWKGDLAKDVMNRRVWGRLDEAERLRVAQSTDHNVLDGIGIGLHRLKRLDRRRVFSDGND